MAKPGIYISTLILIISLISCNQQKRDNSKDSGVNNTEELNSIAANNKLSMELYDKLMNSFGKDWMERESDPDLYPEYYGGSFIDNNGNFVIALTSNIQKVQGLLKEALET